jgi:rod shape determining protein RodA
MSAERAHIGKIDWTTVFIYLAMVLIGWISIYASVYDESHSNILDISQRYGKQMVWILASFALAFIIMMIDGKVFNAFAFLIYGLSLLSLVAVLVFGAEIAGSRSWFQVGDFAIQPSEFAKFATCLALARYLSSYSTDFTRFRSKVIAFVFILAPAALIILQRDAGSAIVYLALSLVLYREGMSGNVLITGVTVVVLFLLTLLINKFILIGILVLVVIMVYYSMRRGRKYLMWIIGGWIAAVLFVLTVDYVFDEVLEPHQKTRINVLLGKEVDLKGAGYNVHQSKIAIGSGGFLGKGFLQGTQTKYNFVPEQSTDFIFCTVGEEWGFVGSVAVVALFIWLLYRLIMMAERQRSDFSRIYGYGVAAIIFFHFLVNIGMTIGLMPVIGIPLPFFSYGGSSLWAFTILLFIFIKLDSNRLMLF